MVATWEDVERIALALERARPGLDHESEPTVMVGRHPFARLRHDETGREIVQFWSQDPDEAAALADRRDTFLRVDTFKVKASVWAWLDMLDEAELAEILDESWRARRGVR